MARIDWERNKRNKAIADASHEQFYEAAKSEFKDPFLLKLLKKGIWPLHGIHKGKKISELPTQYLNWVIKTFEPGAKRNACVNELTLRQSTQGKTPTTGKHSNQHHKGNSRRTAQIAKIQAMRQK